MFDTLGATLGGDAAAFAQLDAAATLGVAADLRAAADRAEVDILQAAVHYADLHPAPFPESDTPPALRSLPGMEEAKVYGGQGCPEVAEFAPIELGAVLGISTYAATRLIGDALALRHRLPKTWARVVAGEVQAWRARQIASACWSLSQAAAALVDAMVADIAHSLGWQRLAKIVKAAVMQADPDAAQDNAKNEKAGRGVWVDPSDLNGTKTVFLKAASGDVIRFDASIDLIADILAELGDTESKDLRIAIVTWIERTYHRRRRQTGLGRLTPIEFETIMTTPATQAA